MQKAPNSVEDFLKSQKEIFGSVEDSLHFHPSWNPPSSVRPSSLYPLHFI